MITLKKSIVLQIATVVACNSRGPGRKPWRENQMVVKHKKAEAGLQSAEKNIFLLL